MNKVQSGNTALITGGSSGIGLAIAHELAKRGYSLVLVSNQPESLAECKAKLEKTHNSPCHTLCVDLSLPGVTDTILKYCDDRQLEVDVLVNNAGFMMFSEVADAPAEKVEAIVNLHMVTPTLLCRAFGSRMKRNRHGFILNVSSISAVMPYPGISLYGPTKTYLRYFSQALRSEMKEYGVRVTCLIPGATATPLHDAEKVNIPLAMKLHVMHSAEYVASRAVRALFRNKAECVPGFLNKLIMLVVPLVPTWLIELINHRTSWLKKG